MNTRQRHHVTFATPSLFPLNIMPYPKPIVFTRTSVDPIMEEVVAVLSDGEPIEFKALFVRVHEELKRKKECRGTEEIVRLRCYDRLLKLAASGLVEKKDKIFRALKGIEQASSRGRAASAKQRG